MDYPLARAAAIVSEMLTTGPVRVDDALAAADAAGLDVDRWDLADQLEEAWTIGPYWALAEQVLPLGVFTHRLSEAEIAGSWIPFHPDLTFLTLAEGNAHPVAGGGEVRELPSEDCARLGAPGGAMSLPAPTMEGRRPGDLLAVRWVDGALDITAVGEDEVAGYDDETVGLLRRVFEDNKGRHGTAFLHDLIAVVLIDHPHVFAQPRPPVGDLLRAAQLDAPGDEVAPSGFDWQQLRATRHEEHLDWTANYYAITRGQAEALDHFSSVYLRAWMDEPPTDEKVAAARPALADLKLATIAVERCHNDLLRQPHKAGDISRVVDLLAGGRAPVGVHLLRAVLADWAGDVAGEQAAVAAAVQADAESTLARAWAARLAFERGDIRQAAVHAVVGEEELPQDLAVAIHVFARPGVMSAGRNEPCPCGSGRKHKVCCGSHHGHPLASRVVALHHKALDYARRPSSVAAGRELFEAFVDHVPFLAEQPFTVDLIEDAGHLLFVGHLLLFEGGLLERYVEQRASLLPADEAALVASWTAARHRVLRIGGAAAGDRFVLHDEVTGDKLEARVASAYLKEGDLALGVVVPGPDDTLILLPGATELTLEQSLLLRDAVQAGDAIDLAEIMADIAFTVGDRWDDDDGWDDDEDEWDEDWDDEDEDWPAGVDFGRIMSTPAGPVVIPPVERWIDRAVWLFPDADPAELAELDLTVEASVGPYVEDLHPELREALDAGETEIEVDGEPFGVELHILMHVLAARSILLDVPPEAWATAQRLEGLGYDRHEILHMLGRPFVNAAWAISHGQPWTNEHHLATLADLPGSWEKERQHRQHRHTPPRRPRGGHRSR